MISVAWLVIGLVLYLIIMLIGKPYVDKKGRARLFDVVAADLVKPWKWMSFVRGTIYAWFLRPHITEQIMLRYLVCPECVEAGKCIDCGCSLDKFMDPRAQCSLGKWGAIEKNPDIWKAIKKEYNIKLNLSYGKQE